MCRPRAARVERHEALREHHQIRATIGRLDDDALFYLRARGVAADAARNLLTYAFANELIDRIRIAPVRAQLAKVLEERFGLDGAGSWGS